MVLWMPVHIVFFAVCPLLIVFCVSQNELEHMCKVLENENEALQSRIKVYQSRA